MALVRSGAQYKITHRLLVTTQSVAFQAWASGSDKQPTSLGLFYRDDSQKRWVLRCNDAKTLARMNMVFVAIEPPGGSAKPTGKQLLRAYLRIQPNHLSLITRKHWYTFGRPAVDGVDPYSRSVQRIGNLNFSSATRWEFPDCSPVLHLIRPNRRVRTRMFGGVAGESGRPLPLCQGVEV